MVETAFTLAVDQRKVRFVSTIFAVFAVTYLKQCCRSSSDGYSPVALARNRVSEFYSKLAPAAESMDASEPPDGGMTVRNLLARRWAWVRTARKHRSRLRSWTVAGVSQ